MISLSRFVALALLAATCTALIGSSVYSYRPIPASTHGSYNAQNILSEYAERNRFRQDLQIHPDLPARHEQREKMTLAIGDRVLVKNFDRTFDAMITALANLDCRVTNMERVSGYITSSLPQLPPEEAEQLRKEERARYAQTKGYSPPCSHLHPARWR